MKRKIFALTLMLTLSLSLMGCIGDDKATDSTDNATVESQDNTTDVESAPADEIDDPADAEDSTSEDKENTDSENEETFWLTATLHKSGKDQSLKEDKWGTSQAIVYDAKIEGDTLTIKGDMFFKNDVSQDPVGVYDKKEIVLKLTDDTKYTLTGGIDENEEIASESISKEEFAKQLTELIDSELGIDIEVKGDTVLSIDIYC